MNSSDEGKRTATTSQGHVLSEATYLDIHFEAARAVYEEMVRSAGLQPGWAVLDAGAGGGSYLAILSALVGKEGSIHAVDLAPENVEAIRERASEGAFDCAVKASAGSITALPAANGAYDAVWCANVLQYLTDEALAMALDEFRRVLRPGGRLIVKDSDFSATLLGNRPQAFWRLIEGGLSHPQFGALTAAYLRTIRLPQTFAQHGIALESYKTFLREWRPPLQPADVAYLRTVLPLYGQVGTWMALPPNEAAFWRRCLDPDAAASYLKADDFYYREAYCLAIGRKGATTP